MKRSIVLLVLSLILTFSFTSCREKTEKEEIIEEMQEDGATMKKKVDGDEVKIKMETEDKEVKIKEEDGETKIKIDDDSDS